MQFATENTTTPSRSKISQTKTPKQKKVNNTNDQQIAQAQDFEIRCQSNLRRKIIVPEERTTQQLRSDLNAIWNNRADFGSTRYYHRTPKQAGARKQGANNTQKNFVWTRDQAQPANRDATRHTGKKHFQQSQPQQSQLKQSQQQVHRPMTSQRMNSSTAVMSLISNQVEKPHAIVKYPNVTGKRHSGSAAHIIQTKSNHRDSKLLAAEQARLQRVAVAKGSTYQSDARKYFGFKSSVLQPKPRLFQQTTARSRVRLNQHTAPLY